MQGPPMAISTYALQCPRNGTCTQAQVSSCCVAEVQNIPPTADLDPAQGNSRKAAINSGGSSKISLRPSQSPCSDRISGSSTWLICAHQLQQPSCNHQWRLQLGHVKWLSQPASVEVVLALPLLINDRSGTGQGGLRSCCAMLIGRSMTRMARCDHKLHVLTRPLAAVLGAAFQPGILLDEVKSTPVFKEGNRCDHANYPMGEPLCSLYFAILTCRIVSCSEKAGLRSPCQAGFQSCMSTKHQLFALRHLMDRSRCQNHPLFAAFVDIGKAYDSMKHPLLWASLQRKEVHGKMLATGHTVIM